MAVTQNLGWAHTVAFLGYFDYMLFSTKKARE